MSHYPLLHTGNEVSKSDRHLLAGIMKSVVAYHMFSSKESACMLAAHRGVCCLGLKLGLSLRRLHLWHLTPPLYEMNIDR